MTRGLPVSQSVAAFALKTYSLRSKHESLLPYIVGRRFDANKAVTNDHQHKGGNIGTIKQWEIQYCIALYPRVMYWDLSLLPSPPGVHAMYRR